MKLSGRVAVVTGSASGIGRATALALASEGAAVVVNYSKSETEAEETAMAVRALGVSCLVVRADVSQEAAARALIARAVEEFGRLDVLVNNAATTVFVDYRDLEALTEEIWDRLYAVNVKGTFWCSRAAVEPMRRSGGGHIINIGSLAGITGLGSSIPYAASKAAVACLTKSLARALAPEIRVNCVAPGFIDTRWNAGREEARRQAAEQAALKRVGTPEDIAQVVRWLATDAAFLTGQVIIADGGRALNL